MGIKPVICFVCHKSKQRKLKSSFICSVLWLSNTELVHTSYMYIMIMVETARFDLCAQNSVCDSFMHAVMQMDIAQSRYMRGIHINQLILLKITQLIVLMSSVIFERLTVRTGGCGCKIEQLCEVS